MSYLALQKPLSAYTKRPSTAPQDARQQQRRQRAEWMAVLPRRERRAARPSEPATACRAVWLIRRSVAAAARACACTFAERWRPRERRLPAGGSAGGGSGPAAHPRRRPPPPAALAGRPSAAACPPEARGCRPPRAGPPEAPAQHAAAPARAAARRAAAPACTGSARGRPFHARCICARCARAVRAAQRAASRSCTASLLVCCALAALCPGNEACVNFYN